MGDVTTYRFAPDWRVAPGATLAEIMEIRGDTVDDLVRLISAGQTDPDVLVGVEALAEGLLDGSAVLTPAVAAILETEYGVSAGFWLALEDAYRKPP